MMISKNVLSLALFLVAGAAANEAAAQELLVPAPRQGYYLGGGFRGGLLTMRGDNVGGMGLMNGGAFTLRAGEMAGSLFGFGLEIATGGGGNKQWGGGYGGLLLDLQLVPYENLALRAGVGLGGVGVSRANKDLMKENDPKGGFGGLYTAGVSYDFFPFWDKGDGSGGFALTTFVELLVLPGNSVSAGAVLMGLEASYWFGLPANKLVE